MATPFTEDGYTDQEADAIHRTIKVYLKPDIRWDRLLDKITVQGGRICKYAQVLYTGDIQRRLKTLETALEAVLSAHDQLGGALQWHLQRQVIEALPRLDEETDPSLPGTMNAALCAVWQAKRRPFDHQYAEEQKRGARANIVMLRLVRHLLYTFEDATGIIPTVYACQHAESGYNGKAYPFLFACLAPLKLIPHEQLSSAILAAYRLARPDILAMREQRQTWQDDADRLKALT